MAFNAGTILANLKLDSKGFKAGINDAQEGSKKLSSNLDNLKKFAKTAAVGIGVLGGAAIAFGKSAVQAASVQQKEEARLATALSNVTGARKEDFLALTKQAQALQQVTTFGDEQIISAQSMLATFQLTGSEISQLTPRILDMAAAVEKTTGGEVDLQQISIALGKAVTGQTGILSRYGVVLTDTQRKQLDAASGMEKMKVMTEILDMNYKGIAEGSAKTFSGRLANLKNNFGDLKEEIGFQLMPTLESLVGDFNNATNSASNTATSSNVLGETLFSVSNFIKGTGLAVFALSQQLAGLGQLFVSLATTGWNFGKDIINMMSDVQQTGSHLFAALRAGLSGDFEAAGKIFSNIFPNIRNEMQKTAFNFKVSFDTFGNTWASALDSFKTAWTKDGYEPVQRDLSDLIGGSSGFNAMGDAAEEAAGKGSEASKEQEKDLAKLQDRTEDYLGSFTTLTDKVKDKVSTLNDKIGDFRKSIRNAKDNAEKDIKSINQSFNDLETQLQTNINQIKDDFSKSFEGITQKFQDEFLNKQTTFQERVANEIIDSEEKKAQAQKSLQEEMAKDEESRNLSKIADLQATIDSENQFLEAHKQDYINFEGAITEARRVRSLDSIELLKEQHTQELVELDERKNSEIAKITELRDEKIRIATETTLAEQAELLKQKETIQNHLKDVVKEFRDKMGKARRKARKKINLIKQDLKGLSSDMKSEFEKVPEALDEAFDKVSKRIKKNMGVIKSDMGEKKEKAGNVAKDVVSGASKNQSINIDGVIINNDTDLETLVTRLSQLMAIS